MHPLEKLAQNPHYQMTSEQLKELEKIRAAKQASQGVPKQYGIVPKQHGEVPKVNNEAEGDNGQAHRDTPQQSSH